MIANVSTSVHDAAAPAELAADRTISIDWRAIIAGAVAAAALLAVLFTFGGGVGLSLTSATPFAGASALMAAILVSIWTAVMSVASFAAGGYVAGRMRLPISVDMEERWFRDGMHGFLVWALGGLLSAFLIASSAAMTASTTAEVVSQTIDRSSADELGEEAITYYADRLLRREAGTTGAANATGDTSLVERSEIVRILTNAIVPGADLPATDRTYLASRVAGETGLPLPEAQQRVEQTYSELRNARDAAAAKAREAIDAARRASASLAFLAAAASLAGLMAAAWAAAAGGRHRDSHQGLTVFGRTQFW